MYTTILFCKYMYMFKDVISGYQACLVHGFGPSDFGRIVGGFFGGGGGGGLGKGFDVVVPASVLGPVN